MPSRILILPAQRSQTKTSKSRFGRVLTEEVVWVYPEANLHQVGIKA
jgi:hypothetical protein